MFRLPDVSSGVISSFLVGWLGRVSEGLRPMGRLGIGVALKGRLEAMDEGLGHSGSCGATHDSFPSF